MKNALEEVTAKKAKKKISNRRWSGVMRRASGRVGRVILRMIPSRRVLHPVLNYAKHLARRGDLLRRAADFNAYGSCRPPQ